MLSPLSLHPKQVVVVVVVVVRKISRRCFEPLASQLHAWDDDDDDDDDDDGGGAGGGAAAAATTTTFYTVMKFHISGMRNTTSQTHLQ
jgi:hypothetical protein